MIKRFLAIAMLAALPMSHVLAQESTPVLAQEMKEEEMSDIENYTWETMEEEEMSDIENYTWETMEEEEMSDIEYYTWKTVAILIPILVLFFLIRKSMKRNQPYLHRSQQHMDRMEEKYDRIIQLLEELTKKRD